jgi:hypothetical protein
MTVDRISCWISVRPAVWASLAMEILPALGELPGSISRPGHGHAVNVRTDRPRHLTERPVTRR